jgi:hypothetical protein
MRARQPAARADHEPITRSKKAAGGADEPGRRSGCSFARCAPECVGSFPSSTACTPEDKTMDDCDEPQQQNGMGGGELTSVKGGFASNDPPAFHRSLSKSKKLPLRPGAQHAGVKASHVLEWRARERREMRRESGSVKRRWVAQAWSIEFRGKKSELELFTVRMLPPSYRLPKNLSVSKNALLNEGSVWLRGDAKHSCATSKSSCQSAPASE